MDATRQQKDPRPFFVVCVLLSAQKCVSLGRPMMWEMRVSLRSDDEHPSRRLTCALSFFSFKKR